MTVKDVVAPENLGAEFDKGAEEAEKIHMRTGRGLWRASDRLESIPLKPEERWVAGGAAAPLPNLVALDEAAATLETGASYTISHEPGLGGPDVLLALGAGHVSAANYPRSTTASNHMLTTRGTTQNPGDDLILTFSMPIIIENLQVSGTIYALNTTPRITVTAPGATWQTLSGSVMPIIGGDTITLSPQLTVIASATPISEMRFAAPHPNVPGRIAISAMHLALPTGASLYTVQRYTDGRLLAVADDDPSDIREDLTGMSVLDTAPLHNYTATGAPTTVDGESSGYGRGSRWNDGTHEYVCMDGTAGAAVWRQVTL